MVEAEGPIGPFEGISVSEARVDSRLPAGVTLCFILSPTPVPSQWKTMFATVTDTKHASVMSNTNPVIHGNTIIWQVIEGDIPNAKRVVEEHVKRANELLVEMVARAAEEESLRREDVLRQLETSSKAEIARLQRILDEA